MNNYGTSGKEYELESTAKAIEKISTTMQPTPADRKRARRTGRFLAKKVKALHGGGDWRVLVW